MDLDLQNTINCAVGRTAPAQLIRGSAGRNERICHCIRVTALSISFPFHSLAKLILLYSHRAMKIWPL